ncbi:uncharacterized protein LOC124362006 isoform X1 [Homalodisca vitripennis]|uniref:uncharacterized protein LOC124362006 isoform X1 n=1 Tax=Homalodisca vitripennis TaxID=197043 RepID=UPI001EEBC01B|nr:uncharacterized protein LOC124362006 isoform X1 [Homalodisca vitripennis]
MDYKDVVFGFSLFIAYTVTILTYAAIGNILAGHKITKVNDFINPVNKEFRGHYGTARKPNLFFLLFYLLFFIALIGSTTQIMKLRTIFRDWIDRVTGSREEEVPVVRLRPAPATADQTHYGAAKRRKGMGAWEDEIVDLEEMQKQRPPETKPKAPETSPSSVSLGSESSKTKVKGARSRSGGKKGPTKDKVPNVMRASVEPRIQVIPPLPRLSTREDTSEKLNRILNKFEAMESDEKLGPQKKATK